MNKKGVDLEQLKKKILDKNTFDPMVDRTFTKTDTNRNGYIEHNELANLLKSIYKALGFPAPPDAEIEKELKRLDKNGDRRISKQEFKILIRDLCLYFIEQAR